MEDKVNYSVVGAFVLALGAALIGGVLWLAAGLGGQQSTVPYQSIVQESVAGLNLDAPVKYLGVNVGKVTSIAIDPADPRQVRLLFQIATGTPVRRDTEAVLKTQGLTGIAYVELNGGSEGSPPLLPTEQEPVPTIVSKPSLSARLENVATSVLANVDRMSTNLNAMFDADNRAALKATLADVAALTHALAAQQGAISAGIADAARTARHAASASEQLAPTLAQIASSAEAVRKMADAATLASAGAGRAADAAASGVQRLSNETMPEVERLLQELNQLASAMRRFSEQTERTPSSLILGGPARPPGPGEKVSP
ncbi:MAG: MCE family protein [Burkholderiaceae bacterium]|nr:MCE family protein [Burkholderiaceae bacterium]